MVDLYFDSILCSFFCVSKFDKAVLITLDANYIL